MLRTLVLFACLVPCASASVIVVDPLGGPGVLMLQAALGNVHEGDIILVKPGDYESGGGFYTLPAVGFALVADGNGANIVLKPLQISSLPADREILVRGFWLSATIPFLSSVAGCDGRVRFEECTIIGSPGHSAFFMPGGWLHFPGLPGLHVQTSPDVALVRCTLYGGKGQDGFDAVSGQSTDGGAALTVDDARVVLADCTLNGGDGGDEAVASLGAGDGAPAVLFEGTADSSHAMVFGSSLQAGDGGSAAQAGGDGGPAFGGTSGATLVWLRGSALDGGAGGSGAVPGTAGPDLDLAITPTTFPAKWCSLTVPSPVREGDPHTLILSGPAFEQALLLAATTGWMQPKSKWQGALLVEPTFLSIFALGSMGGGVLGVPFTVPLLPPGEDGVVISLQAVIAGNPPTLGAGGDLVWVDASF